MNSRSDIVQELQRKFGENTVGLQTTRDEEPTLWVPSDKLRAILNYLKTETPGPYQMLYDLTAIDERDRSNRHGQPACDFTVVYHLLSFDRNADLRIKVGLKDEELRIPSITDIWPSANWYEREVWDMFGIGFDGHPNLRRILMPPTWEGHPLRKEHPARATEMERFRLPEEKAAALDETLQFRPEDWGMRRSAKNTDFMFLNMGPQHPGTHGLLRIVLELDGEQIVDAVPDIGYHHRGAEKMGERQSWHTFIPYTDRIDYLGGVMNNFPYVLAVEKLAGINRPGQGQNHPDNDGGILSDSQSSGLVRHVCPGCGSNVPGFLYVQ